MQCSDKVFLIKKEGVSFVVDSVSYPALPVPLANATGAIGDNCIYIAGGQEMLPIRIIVRLLRLREVVVKLLWKQNVIFLPKDSFNPVYIRP